MPSESWWYMLESAYTEPHRHYHTLTHIDDGLDVLDKLGADLAVKVAFWFHDLYYDVAANDNEERSAKTADHLLPDIPLCYGMDLKQEVVRLILLTKDHKVAWFDKNGCDMIVADLHGLGSDPETYDHNTANIRLEYSGFDEGQWRKGRSAFLSKMTSRRIFPPKPEYDQIEDQAFQNMITELAKL